MKTVIVKISPLAEKTLRHFLLVCGLKRDDDLSDSFTARVVTADDGATVEIALAGEECTTRAS